MRAARAESAQSANPQPSFYPSAPATSEWNHTPEPTPQQINPASSYAPESGADTFEEGFGAEDEGQILDSSLNNGASILNHCNSLTSLLFSICTSVSIVWHEIIDLLVITWDFNYFLFVVSRIDTFT